MALKFLCSSQPNSVTAIIPDDEDQYDILPMVYFTNKAQRTIDYVVAESDDEVAWLGTVSELENGDYCVEEIFIPEQEVSAATVDISADAMGKLVNDLMDMGLDPNTLRYHGHSHVNMSVGPSGVDQDHIAEYLEGVDWFIRSIHNKKGDKRIDVFEKFNQRVINCVDSDVWEHILPDEYYDELSAQLEERVQIRQAPRHNPKTVAFKTLREEEERFKPGSNPVTPQMAHPGGGLNGFEYYQLDDYGDAEDARAYYEKLIDPFFAGKA